MVSLIRWSSVENGISGITNPSLGAAILRGKPGRNEKVVYRNSTR